MPYMFTTCDPAGILLAKALMRLMPLPAPRSLACRGGARRHSIKDGDHVLDLGAIEALCDEDDLAAPVGIGPVIEPGEIVQQVLDTLDDCRAVGFFGDVNDTLHAQEICTEILL